jgi:hypothetical protein
MAEGNTVNIDLLKATDEDLLSIKNEIIKRLAERTRSGLQLLEYDRHGSGHSRSKPPPRVEDIITLPSSPAR